MHISFSLFSLSFTLISSDSEAHLSWTDTVPTAHLSPCPSSTTQAPAQRRQRRLIYSFSALISLLSHFSSTLSLNLSPSQTPRPMIASSGFWFCHHDWQNNIVAVIRFWFCWWLMNGGLLMVFGFLWFRGGFWLI